MNIFQQLGLMLLEFGVEDVELSLWAATLVLMPWSVLRRKHDLFCGLLLAFVMLGIGIMDRMESMRIACC